MRRRELLEAAVSVFSEKGIASASVDDIVRAAGVAKGTFYLYFATKDDAINAVAEWMVETRGRADPGGRGRADRSPVERLLAFGASVRQVGGEPFERDLVEVDPPPRESRPSRPDGRAGPEPACSGGRSDHRVWYRAWAVRRQDPERAGAWVMACFGSLHEVVSEPGDVPLAIDELNAFVLGGLGYRGVAGR